MVFIHIVIHPLRGHFQIHANYLINFIMMLWGRGVRAEPSVYVYGFQLLCHNAKDGEMELGSRS